MIDTCMSKSQIAGLGMRLRLTWGSKIMRSICPMWRSSKITQKHIFYEHFEVFCWSSNVTSLCLNLIMSSSFFTNLLHNAVFNSLKYIFDLLSVFRELSNFPHHPQTSPLPQRATNWNFYYIIFLEYLVALVRTKSSRIWSQRICALVDIVSVMKSYEGSNYRRCRSYEGFHPQLFFLLHFSLPLLSITLQYLWYYLCNSYIKIVFNFPVCTGITDTRNYFSKNKVILLLETFNLRAKSNTDTLKP